MITDKDITKLKTIFPTKKDMDEKFLTKEEHYKSVDEILDYIRVVNENTVQTVLKAMSEFKKEMRNEFTEFKTEMRTEFVEFKKEMHNDFNSFKDIMVEEYNKTRTDVFNVKVKQHNHEHRISKIEKQTVV